MANIIKHKRGTAAQWTSINPILADGELGLETDTHKFKFGDGVTAWNVLEYAGGSTIDAYTKAETDELLDEKENKITALSPLTLAETTKSPLKGFNYATETTVYPTTAIAIGDGKLWGATPTSFNSYIDIPYALGDVVEVPKLKGKNITGMNVYPMGAIMGYEDSEGYFHPVVWCDFSGFPHVANSDDEWQLINSAYYLPASQTLSLNIGSTTHGQKQRFQIWEVNSTTLGIGADFGISSLWYSWQSGSTQNYVHWDTISDPGMVARLRRVNIVRFIASSNSSTITYNVSYFGRYNVGGAPALQNTAASQAIISGLGTTYPNLFSINEAVVNNYLELNYDDTTLGVDANNKLYAKLPTVNNSTITFTQDGTTVGTITTNQGTDTTIDFQGGGGETSVNPKEPLANERVQLSGPVNFDLTSGSMVPTYPTNVNATSSGSNIVFSNSTLTAQPSTMADIFSGNVSYVDIPTDYGERVANYQDGSGSNYDCTIALLAERSSSVSTNKMLALFCNKSDSGEITPYIVAQATCNSTASNACAYLGETITGTSTTNLMVNTLAISSTVSTGTVSTASNQLQIQLGYNGSNWNLSSTGYSASGSSSSYYTRSIGYADSNRDFMTRLRNCNCIRLFFYNTTNTQAVCANNTNTYIQYYGATTGWVTQPWRVTDDPTYQDSLILKYDGSTLKTNNNGELYADITIPSVTVDGDTITRNLSDELQTIGVIDNNSGNAKKQWYGTEQEYQAITTPDADTIYHITGTPSPNFVADTPLSLAEVSGTNHLSLSESTVASYGMPSTHTQSLTVGATGTTYTAPANGYFCFYVWSNSTTLQYASIGNPNITTGGQPFTQYVHNCKLSGPEATMVLPVKAGDTVGIDYNYTGSTVLFFVYAEGEEV